MQQTIFRVLPGYLSKRQLCHSAQLNILSPAALGARNPVQRIVNVSAEGQTIGGKRLWLALILVSTASSSFFLSLRLSDHVASANVTLSTPIVPLSLAQCERANNSSEQPRATPQGTSPTFSFLAPLSPRSFGKAHDPTR